MKKLEHEGLMNRGIQTFMKSDYVDIEDLDIYDVAYIGVPVDHGASYRKGQALAPKSIREHSYWDAVNGSKYVDTETGQLLTSNKLRIADVGDIHISVANVEQNQTRISQTISSVRQRCFPLIIGGDHSISYSTIKGIRKHVAKEDLAILHFDAHIDMESEYIDFPSVFHGNPFSKLIEEGIVNGNQHYAIGPRGMIPQYLMEFVQDNKVNLITTPEIRKHNYKEYVSSLVEELSNRFKAVFVTFDVDCIDATEMRGTGTPMEGGLTALECQYFLRSLKQLPVVGFELVELAPDLDPSGLSSIIATNLLWQFLSFGLDLNEKK